LKRGPGEPGPLEWCGSTSDAAATPIGQPALAKSATLVFGVATPHASFLIGFEGVLEAVLVHGTRAANLFGGDDLCNSGSSGADGEEQGGV
jgi:hypothetical protein